MPTLILGNKYANISKIVLKLKKIYLVQLLDNAQDPFGLSGLKRLA